MTDPTPLLDDLAGAREVQKALRLLDSPLPNSQTLTIVADQIKKEILVKFELVCAERKLHYIQEAGISIEEIQGGAPLALSLLLQASGEFLAEFVNDGELNRLPLEWSVRDYRGKPLRIRVSMSRPAIEDMADTWLADNGN